MEFRGFFKNTSMKRGDQIKVEVCRQNKMQRAKSRHEMRQTYRSNMGCDSEEENDVPPVQETYDAFRQQQLQRQQSTKLGETMTVKNKNLSQEERFQIRLLRLQEFRERKRRMQLEQRSKQIVPFVPFVSKNIIVNEMKSLQSVESARKKPTPLGECQELMNQIPARTNKTPVLNKCIKSRVDCWRKDQLPRKATECDLPPQKPVSGKKAVPPIIKSVERPKVSKPTVKQRPKETKPPAVVQPVMQVRHAVVTKPVEKRPLSEKFVFKLKPPVADNGSSSNIVTSTVRKHRKPLTFSFEHTSEIQKPKATLTVNRADELFDGISPIEVESSPQKPLIAINGVGHSSPTVEIVPIKTEESLWEPQPIASLSVYETTVQENCNSLTAAVETKFKPDCSIGDWVPAAVHEVSSDSIIIVQDDDDEVFQETAQFASNLAPEDRPRKPTMNESFTITKPGLNESFTLNVGSVPSHDLLANLPSEPTVVRLSTGPMVQNVMALSERPIQERRQSSPKEIKLNGSSKSSRVSSEPLNEPETEGPSQQRHKSSPKESKLSGSSKGTRGSSETSNEPKTKRAIQERRNSSPKESKLNGSAIRKRASLIFTEEPIECDIVPSKSNLTLAEKQRQSLDDGQSSTTSQSSPDEPEDTKPPKEVEEKTRYYYDKVDSELARLQALCDEYAPFLAEDQELNDHCRGLIIAAQGQTNILIKKKLTKFRELIGHYETKWNDRKVRHDDLDGFWIMLSLDLDNLDKRFEELRALKENGWQEIVPEPKMKKLQGGGGVRKREKKPTVANAKKSSAIADLIRKARQEAKQKQKTAIAELDVLKDTVTVVTTPVKRAVRFVESPARRTSLPKRSSLCAGCTPTTVHWNQEPNANLSKRHTIFPEITQKSELVKSILKPAKVARGRRAKSVLFLDGGLETPQARRRHSSRKIVDTPKPQIKFNEELEIEHIDNLAARTPSRLELEIQKRRQQSLLESASLLLPSSDDNDKDTDQQRKRSTRKAYAQGTPCRDSGSVRRSNRRTSRCIATLFDGESSNSCNDFKTEDESEGSAKRSSRRNARKKLLDN
ncbi:uncharacterized protein LOC126568791 [Anopheles maculipalpis]|uniref:uncharacterized protein LOC126568791 n=1 Tax=Anopheles maculipalpis TaxID=1496333 RepID=UPI002158E8D3|nr:uncharacterized protein LOC126568791 [Anopheles maculipalpis]